MEILTILKAKVNKSGYHILEHTILFNQTQRNMEIFKFHSVGRNDHLKIIKEKYNILKNELVKREDLNESEKNAELKNLEKSFKNEKRELLNNFY